MAGSGPGKFAEIGGSASQAPRGYLLYNFDPGKADLKPEHEAGLREWVTGIARHPRNQVLLTGRASRSESPAPDIGVSQERADAVKRLLVAEGVPAGRIQVQSRGEPFGFPNGPEEDRSVVILPVVPAEFVVRFVVNTSVQGIDWGAVEQTLRDGLGSLATAAGRSLVVLRGSSRREEDVTVEFVDSHQSYVPCKSVMIMLGMAGRYVHVNTHLQLRTCEGSRPGAPLFRAGDRTFAAALGNTAVHELGHRLYLDDLPGEMSNFMYEAVKGGGGAAALRSRESAYERLSGKKSWTQAQRETLLRSVAMGTYDTGMTADGA